MKGTLIRRDRSLHRTHFQVRDIAQRDMVVQAIAILVELSLSRRLDFSVKCEFVNICFRL